MGQKQLLCGAPRAEAMVASWAERLVEARLDAGLTQADLVRATDLTQGTISRYEGGLQIPSVGSQVQLADALGMSVTELFPRTPEEAVLG